MFHLSLQHFQTIFSYRHNNIMFILIITTLSASSLICPQFSICNNAVQFIQFFSSLCISIFYFRYLWREKEKKKICKNVNKVKWVTLNTFSSPFKINLGSQSVLRDFLFKKRPTKVSVLLVQGLIGKKSFILCIAWALGDINEFNLLDQV